MQITTDLFAFPFRDPRWKSKAAVGGLIGLIAMVFFPAFWLIEGYGVQVLRQTAKGDDPTLPEWDDWGALILDGLRFTAVYLVYNLPVIVLSLIMMAVLFFTFMGIPMAAAGGGDSRDLDIAAGLLFAGGMGAIGLCSAVVLIVSFPLQFFSLVAITRAIALDRLSAAFEFGEVWRMVKGKLGNYLIAFIILYAVLMGLSLALSLTIYTVVLCVIYPVLYGLMMTYISVIAGALFGKAYAESQNAPAPSGV